MELRELTTKDYLDEAIVTGWKADPHEVMLGVNAKLDKFNLKVVQYETYNNNYCFAIVKK